MTDGMTHRRPGAGRGRRLIASCAGALALAVLALTSIGGACGQSPPPMSETCQVPAGYLPPTLDDLQIGQVGSDGRFRAFTQGEVVPLVFGGQGAPMVVANLRVRGAGVGACLAQRTLIEIPGGELITSEEAAMTTRPDGTGAWITGDLLLVYYNESGRLVRLRAEVAGRTATVEIWTDMIGAPDAGIDAPVDARPDAPPPVDAPPAPSDAPAGR